MPATMTSTPAARLKTTPHSGFRFSSMAGRIPCGIESADLSSLSINMSTSSQRSRLHQRRRPIEFLSVSNGGRIPIETLPTFLQIISRTS
jgi:hypothetical protein